MATMYGMSSRPPWVIRDLKNKQTTTHQDDTRISDLVVGEELLKQGIEIQTRGGKIN